MNIESTLFGRVEKPKSPKLGRGGSVAKALKGRRNAIFAANGRPQRTPVYDGALLGAGAAVQGPAIIEEETTTIVVDPDSTIKLDASGSYIMTRRKSRRRS